MVPGGRGATDFRSPKTNTANSLRRSTSLQLRNALRIADARVLNHRIPQPDCRKDVSDSVVAKPDLNLESRSSSGQNGRFIFSRLESHLTRHASCLL